VSAFTARPDRLRWMVGWAAEVPRKVSLSKDIPAALTCYLPARYAGAASDYAARTPALGGASSTDLPPDLPPDWMRIAENDLQTKITAMPKNTAASTRLRLRSSSIASSTARSPKRVVNLMIGFIATEEVSLNGSPTVSPTTVAACRGVPFSFS